VQKYPVRTSHRGQLNPEAIAGLLREAFGTAAPDGTGAATRFGAIERLVARPDGRDLAIDITMNPKVSNEVAADTIARYNRFLEAATGYSAKERAKRLRKSATGPAAEA